MVKCLLLVSSNPVHLFFTHNVVCVRLMCSVPVFSVLNHDIVCSIGFLLSHGTCSSPGTTKVFFFFFSWDAIRASSLSLDT